MDDHPISQTLDIPNQVPVMTLPHTVLFPQAILPLYIFEPRYRKMLLDVLRGDRIFAIASLKQDPERDVEEEESQPEEDYFEPPYPVASIGIVRACHENDDGTSNLVLQGLSRIRVDEILTETPYRKARISPIYSTRDNPELDLKTIRRNCLEMIARKLELQAEDSRENEAFHFLRQIRDPDTFIDLACFSILENPFHKQELLETTAVERRFTGFQHWLKKEIESLKLYQYLKGDLKDEDILNN